MKKIYAFIVIALALISIFFIQKNDSEYLFDANVEALTQSELPGAQIMCNSGNCGRCFEERTAWPVYKCTWTGSQEDYCDCDKLGYLSANDQEVI